MSRTETTTEVTRKWVQSQTKDNLYMLIQMLMKKADLQEKSLRNIRALAVMQLRRNANLGTVDMSRALIRFCEEAGIFGSILREGGESDD